MKIGKRSVTSTYSPASKNYGNAKKVDGPSATGNDSIEVSQSGELFRAAQQAAQRTPEIRTEAVAGIQRELADGTYQRNDEEVANKVIQEHLGQRPGI